MAHLPLNVVATVLTLTLLSPVQCDEPIPADFDPATAIADSRPVSDPGDFVDALGASFAADPHFNQSHYDGCGFQLENKHPDEIQGNRTFDDEYNAQFIDSLAKHAPVPTVQELRELLKTKNIDFGANYEYSQLSLYVANPWWRLLLAANSCPRTQNYGCRSVYHKLPCWRRYTTAGWHYCCPIWPQSIVNRVAHCNCCACARLSLYGPECGECHRRYRWQRITSVCSAWNTQPYLISQSRYIPTSCYCKV